MPTLPPEENIQVTREGDYYVEVNVLDTYDLKGHPVCGNCLVPIFPSIFWFVCREESIQCSKPEEHGDLKWYSVYNSRGTDEPAECDECVEAIDSGDCGCHEDCDKCIELGEKAYDERTKPPC